MCSVNFIRLLASIIVACNLSLLAADRPQLFDIDEHLAKLSAKSADAPLNEKKQEHVPTETQGPKYAFLPNITLFHYAINEDLTQLIRNIFSMAHLDVVVSGKVTGNVSKPFENITPRTFLEEICRTYNLSWFYDGNILYVYKSEETDSQVFSVPSSKVGPIMAVVRKLNFEGPSTVIRSIDNADVIFVSGPPRFVSIIGDVVNKMNPQTIRSDKEVVVRLFSLRYACAYDLQFSGVKIPGVTSLLNEVLGKGGPSGAYTNKTNDLAASHQNNPLKGAIDFSKNANGNYPEQKPEKPDAEDSKPDIGIRTGLITMDTRLNMVIVRDLKERMPMYEDIIRQLDVSTKLIEINAAIMDVKKTRDRMFGSQAAKLFKDGGNTFTYLQNPDQPSAIDSMKSSFAVNMKGLVNGKDFLYNVIAQEAKGTAKVLARPTVLTLDNVEALIQREQMDYQVAHGKDVTNLYPISSRTTLRVTPHTLREENEDRIKLIVTIEDGATETSADAKRPPTVNSTTITTQAVVPEGQSLLVGGYFKETKSVDEDGIPFLKDIPILGLLAKKSARSANITERMFLITPHIVTLSADDDRYAQYFYKPEGEPAQSVLNAIEASEKES